MTPDLAVKVTQNLQSRYARLRRGCWRLLRANATLRQQVAELEGQLAITKATAEIALKVSVELTADGRERNARIAELEAQLAAASQPERRWQPVDEALPEPAAHISEAMQHMYEVRCRAVFYAYNTGGWATEWASVTHWRPLEGGESDASTD